MLLRRLIKGRSLRGFPTPKAKGTVAALILMGTTLCFLLSEVEGWGAWGAPASASCNSTNETASQTLSCTVPSAAFNVDNVIVVNCSGDNTATLDGASDTHASVTDSSGNTYTKAYEWTEAGTGAGGGATVSIWFTKVTTELGTGGTITCDYGSSITDRVMHSVREFTIGAGNVVSVVGTSQGEASNGGDAGPLTISGLTNAEYLFVRGIATESNAAVSMTATTSYTFPVGVSDGCNNTTGGGEASDMGACSEWRIFTGTGDTSDPTLVDTSNDNASVYVALQEAAAPSGAPQIIISQRSRRAVDQTRREP